MKKLKQENINLLHNLIIKNMKLHNSKIGILVLFVSFALIFSSCNKEENNKSGFVTFGANYNIINCISTVTIYLDDKNIGVLTSPIDTILDCGQDQNITKEVLVGNHSYKVEIRPESGTGCTKDINGSFEIKENECKKIFIDYRIIWNE